MHLSMPSPTSDVWAIAHLDSGWGILNLRSGVRQLQIAIRKEKTVIVKLQTATCTEECNRAVVRL